jgi:hypothetical protein
MLIGFIIDDTVFCNAEIFEVEFANDIFTTGQQAMSKC